MPAAGSNTIEQPAAWGKIIAQHFLFQVASRSKPLKQVLGLTQS
ncbi:MAG TPA: hypothetical protein V6D09_17945 [Leptolyngbyaceae cyanobacterium]